MQHWEYKCLSDLPPEKHLEGMSIVSVADLNALGVVGWELVGVTLVPRRPGWTGELWSCREYTFKRPLD
jgi:hypothetical protein